MKMVTQKSRRVSSRLVGGENQLVMRSACKLVCLPRVVTLSTLVDCLGCRGRGGKERVLPILFHSEPLSLPASPGKNSISFLVPHQIYAVLLGHSFVSLPAIFAGMNPWHHHHYSAVEQIITQVAPFEV